MNFDELSPEERLIAEQAVLNLRSLNKACDAAADGTVLAIAEQVAMTQGRELIRRTLQTSLDQQIQTVEKKGRRSGRVRAD
jgi:hypothetical protein